MNDPVRRMVVTFEVIGDQLIMRRTCDEFPMGDFPRCVQMLAEDLGAEAKQCVCGGLDRWVHEIVGDEVPEAPGGKDE